MPRKSPSCVNQPLVDFLLTLVPDLGENKQRIVRRAARNLRSHPTPILTKDDALSVHGIGQWIATQIEVYIANNSSEFRMSERSDATLRQQNNALQPTRSSSGSQAPCTAVVSHQDADNIGPLAISQSTSVRASRKGRSGGAGNIACATQNEQNVTNSDGNGENNNQRRGTTRTDLSTRKRNGVRSSPRNSPYRPGYRTASYAILIALREGLTVGKISMMKAELADAAQKHCDIPIVLPHNEDRHTWFDGWSCVNKTLIRKGLVAKFGNPAKFQLTMEGRVLVDSLDVEHLDAQQPLLADSGRPVPSDLSVRPGRSNDVPTLSRPLSIRSSPVNDDPNNCNLTSSTPNSPVSPTNAPNFTASISNEPPCMALRKDSVVFQSSQAALLNTNILPGPSRFARSTTPVPIANDISHLQTIATSSGNHVHDIQILEAHRSLRSPDKNTNLLQNVVSEKATAILVNTGSSEQLLQSVSLSGLFIEQAREYLQTQYNTGHSFGSMFAVRVSQIEDLPQSRAQQTATLSVSAAPVDPINPSHMLERNIADLRGKASALVGTQHESRPIQKRFSEAQVERAVRVIKRLTSYPEEVCLLALAEVFERGDFPRTDDKLYEVLSNRIWERHREEMNVNDTCIPATTKLTVLHTTVRSTASDCLSLSDCNGDDEIEPVFNRPTTACSVSKTVVVPTEVETIDLEAPERVIDSAEVDLSTLKEGSASNDVISIDDDSDNDSVFVRTCSVPVSVKSPPAKRPRVISNGRVEEDSLPLSADCLGERNESLEPDGLFSTRDEARSDDMLLDDSPPVMISEPWTRNVLPHNFVPDIAGDLQRSVDMSVQATVEGPRVVLGFRSNLESDQRDDRGNLGETGGSNMSKCKVLVILDKMERFRNRSNERWREMAKLLENTGATCNARVLPCGDAMFVAQYEDGSEVVLDYIIERKTVEDFASSVYDGRVSRQAYMMRQCKISHRMFVIEGDLKENSRVYDNPEVHKKLADLEVCEDFYVKHTKDLMDTVWFYASLRQRLQQKFGAIKKDVLLDKRSLFTEWMERMKKMTRGLTLGQLFTMQLCQIPGVGESKARAILSRGYDTPQKLHRAYQHADNAIEREELLKGTGVGGGATASRTVHKLFNNMQYGTALATSSRSRSESIKR